MRYARKLIENEKQLLTKCIINASDGTQMERKVYFTHCCTWLLCKWKLSRVKTFANFKIFPHPRIFVQGLQSVWAAIGDSFIRKTLHLNRSAKVFTCKSFCLLNRQRRRVCDHAHLPHPRTTWIAISSENPAIHQPLNQSFFKSGIP